MGFDMTVTMFAEWALVRARTNVEVWKRSIKTTHTATVGDAFVGVTRLRLANEGAAKENIRKGLEALGGASIGSSGG